MPTVITSMKEFASQTNAGEPLWDGEKNCFRFANGSISDGEHHHRLPPGDPKELLDRKIAFAEVQVRHATSELKNSSERYSMACQFWAGGHGGPLPTEDWRDELRKLKSDLQAFEKQLSELKAERQPAATKTPYHERERINRRAEANQAMGQLANILGHNTTLH